MVKGTAGERHVVARLKESVPLKRIEHYIEILKNKTLFMEKIDPKIRKTHFFHSQPLITTIPGLSIA